MIPTYLAKFSAVPKEIKDKIASPEVTARITELAEAYHVDLASTIMKVMVKELKLENLGAYLINELRLGGDQATQLERSLRREVFTDVIDYLLGADKGPKLVFSEADERQVRQTTHDVSTADFDKTIDQSVENIVTQSRVNFGDPLSAGKFRQVMKTYLRGTRDKLSVLEVLTKAAELGGIALNRDTADRIVLLAANFLPKALSAVPRPKIQIPSAPAAERPLRPVAPSIGDLVDTYDLAQSLKSQGKLKKTSKPFVAVTPVALDVDHEIAPPPPVIVPAAAKQILKETIAGKPLDKPALRRIAATPPAVNNLLKSSTGKIKMDDIHFSSQAMSPIDELKYFTLTNFRRLDPDPLKAGEKIKEKLELLNREDYAKKIEGIVAWQGNPLNKLYLSICRRSLDDNIPLDKLLERENKRDPKFMKPQEMSAIIALNRSLRF